jgi:FixJ family two-component response regulator
MSCFVGFAEKSFWQREQTLREPPLSRRELQVLIALGDGKTTVEIRSVLSVLEKTVATYVHRLKKKLLFLFVSTTLDYCVWANATLRQLRTLEQNFFPRTSAWRND